MDIVSKSHRSRMMAGIKAGDTEPEKSMRSALHTLGFRFRLHNQKLPGRPDIVLSRYKTVIFVNGCFWHHHLRCKYAYIPKSNIHFWKKKFSENRKRDAVVHRKLRRLGWQVFVVWECQTIRSGVVAKRIDRAIRRSRKRRSSIH